MKSIEQRLLSKIERHQDCWLWTGTLKNGYGELEVKGRKLYAHRLAYDVWVGEILDAHLVVQTCENRLCIAPKHLELRTRNEHMRVLHLAGRMSKPPRKKPTIDPNRPTKRCGRCQKDLFRQHFGKQVKTSDGLRAYCQSCEALWKAQWLAVNPEKRRAYAQRYRQSHPEIFALINRRRYLRRKGGFTKTSQDYERILVQDPCSYCGQATTTIDHITPVVALGDSHWSNLTAACRSCNSRKSSRSLLDFLLLRARSA